MRIKAIGRQAPLRCLVQPFGLNVRGRTSSVQRLRILFVVLLILVPLTAPADSGARYRQALDFFPGADRIGEPAGAPPSVEVYAGKQLLGYAFLSADVVRIPAYSGKPINTLVAFDLAGRITGLRIVEHEEPILVIGISDADLARFIGQYRGKRVFDRIAIGGTREGHISIDTISGATITVMVENASIMQSLRKVAESRGFTPERVAAASASAPPLPAQTTASKPPAAAAPRPLPKPAVASGVDDEPIWITVWRNRVIEITGLLLGLALLTAILVFQDWLARRPQLLKPLRTGFLIYTVVFIGWYTLGQLSVVNVLTFSHAAMHNFRWESFLIDPMLFILWSFVAVTLLLWGRGVYCGWLCPFGALQELTYQALQKVKLPRFEFPQMVHERMWALKYVILLALFGVSLQSLAQAERLAEVEPFKTAFVMRFAREWGFVLYAVVLIGISALNRKFFCKYLCALGAALTIPAKFRIFDWLRRHRECGRPCQVCAVECEVQAIRKNGEINANECHYCLDCQMTYWNDHKCPPEVERRKRRQKSVRARELVRGMEEHLGPSGLEPPGVQVPPPVPPRERS